MKRYSGRLYYDEHALNGYFDVVDFIVRGDSIAFTLAEVTAEHGRWEATGVANMKPDSEFVADNIQAYFGKIKSDVEVSHPWNLKFRIEAYSDDILNVEGTIAAGGNIEKFSGDLDLEVKRNAT